MVTSLSAAIVSTEFYMILFWIQWVSSAGLSQQWRTEEMALAMFKDSVSNPSSEGAWLSEVPAR